jgi:hypothetical protein
MKSSKLKSSTLMKGKSKTKRSWKVSWLKNLKNPCLSTDPNSNAITFLNTKAVRTA